MAGDTARVSVEASWPMGHRLQHHDGKCRGLHGHTYRMRAVFSGPVSARRGHPSEGMVADFTRLKAAVRGLANEMDHALMLEASDPCADACRDYARVVSVPWPPTAERIAQYLRGALHAAALLEGVECVGVTVWESDTTSAEATA